jgi:hypothetical protein
LKITVAAAAAGSSRLFELATAGIRQMHHRANDFDVIESAATLSAHGAFALEGGLSQAVQPKAQAGRPVAGIAEAGGAHQTGVVTGRALGLVDIGTGCITRLASRNSTEPTRWMRCAVASSTSTAPAAGLKSRVT